MSSLCLHARRLLGWLGLLGVTGRDTAGAHGLQGCGAALPPCSASHSKAEERGIFLYLRAAPF